MHGWIMQRNLQYWPNCGLMLSVEHVSIRKNFSSNSDMCSVCHSLQPSECTGMVWLLSGNTPKSASSPAEIHKTTLVLHLACWHTYPLLCVLIFQHLRLSTHVLALPVSTVGGDFMSVGRPLFLLGLKSPLSCNGMLFVHRSCSALIGGRWSPAHI